MGTPLTFISKFIIGGLQKDVTVEILYKELELDRYPNKAIIELSLVVDKKGNSKGWALLQIPRSCSKRLLSNDQREINGSRLVITHQEGNNHMMRDRRWEKNYRDKGMIKAVPPRPQTMVYRYKSTKSEAMSANQKTDIDPLYDMFADLTHKKFSPDLDTVLTQSYQLGVAGIVIPVQCGKKKQDALDILEEFDTFMEVYLSTGIAPLHAADYNTTDQNDLEKECTTGRCMGPIGLDFGLENVPQEQQIHAFEEQLKLACDKKKSLYLVEHKAHEKFVAILSKYEKQLPKCAIVNFSGTYEELEKYISMGFYIVVYGSISKSKCVLTSVLTKALAQDIIPRKRILLSSNAPRPPSSSSLAISGYRPSISDMSLKKIPQKSSSRSEPLCIFATLELIAKHLGYDKTEEINDLGKRIVKNSKKFLNKISSKKSKKSEHKKKPVIYLSYEEDKQVNKPFVTFAFLVLLLAIYLEFISGIPDIRSRYFYQQGIF